MCGITAVLTLTGRSRSEEPYPPSRPTGAKIPNGSVNDEEHGDTLPKLSEGLLDKSLSYITHRGPDHAGSWVSDDGLTGPLIGQLDVGYTS